MFFGITIYWKSIQFCFYIIFEWVFVKLTRMAKLKDFRGTLLCTFFRFMRSNRFHPVNCQPHSYPQLNFMLNATRLYQNLKLVAALEEMKDVLLMIGFPFNDEFGHVRKSATSLEKLAYYPIRIDMLSNDTLLDICDFLALDYCFLDFKPPDICMSLINKICNGEIS